MDALAGGPVATPNDEAPYTMTTEEYRLQTGAERFDELADEYESRGMPHRWVRTSSARRSRLSSLSCPRRRGASSTSALGRAGGAGL
jgi:hypothetical protein